VRPRHDRALVRARPCAAAAASPFPHPTHSLPSPGRHADKREWSRIEYASPSPGPRENNGVVGHNFKVLMSRCVALHPCPCPSPAHALPTLVPLPTHSCTHTFHPLPTPPPPPRTPGGPADVLCHGRLVLWQGLTHPLWGLCLPTGGVPECAPAGLCARVLVCACSLHRPVQVYLFGGYNGSEWLSDFHEFDLGA
jgi:hypothetical protein